MENRFNIQSDEEGKRLDVFLAEKLSITRSKVKEIFDQGFVRIAGKIPKPSFKVRKGLVIEGVIPEEKPLSLAPQNISLDILYEDEHILAVNKPNGMVVHPSFGHSEGTLVNAILGYLQKAGDGQSLLGGTSWEMGDRNPSELAPLGVRPGIVHRLDKGTTGVILVAKDPRSQEMLSGFFKKRIVQKTYRVIVEGIVRNNEGVITGSIGRHPIQRKKMAVLKRGGRESETAYKILQKLDGFTYIEAYPKTGRTHQIRVHLAHIGHPVVGDEAYGGKAKHITDRPLLHAYTVSFPHPVRGLPIVIKAPVPEDMTHFIAEHEVVKSETGGKSGDSKK
ncbi:MAG: pseudouridine synthase, RluA family [Deltaproteobacteria bacterium]|nr:pseudouridine synthase, RluA family [Deltaproteobacteria bacterium]